MTTYAPFRLPRAYYCAAVRAFLESEDDRILGALTAHSDMSIEPAQRDAWLEEITILKRSLDWLDGMLALEFNIPRMGRRIDAVVVVRALVAVIEFKVGETTYTRSDINQVWDYALDLKNFHAMSHDATIVPILVATDAPAGTVTLSGGHEDDVYTPVTTNSAGLRAALELGVAAASGNALDGQAWY